MTGRRRCGDSVLARKLAAAALAIGLAGVLSSCEEYYYEHQDTITHGTGDAVAHNRTLQTVDPWPYHAGKTRIDSNGARIGLAFDRYKQNQAVAPKGLTEDSKGDGDAAGGAPPAPAPN